MDDASVHPGPPSGTAVPDKPVTLVLGGITVAAAALRFAKLGIQSFWFDEAVTVNLARNSLRGMLTGIREVESTPPLYYVVAWFWEKFSVRARLLYGRCRLYSERQRCLSLM